jgi:hypothetical protein
MLEMSALESIDIDDETDFRIASSLLSAGIPTLLPALAEANKWESDGLASSAAPAR